MKRNTKKTALDLEVKRLTKAVLKGCCCWPWGDPDPSPKPCYWIFYKSSEPKPCYWIFYKKSNPNPPATCEGTGDVNAGCVTTTLKTITYKAG